MASASSGLTSECAERVLQAAGPAAWTAPLLHQPMHAPRRQSASSTPLPQHTRPSPDMSVTDCFPRCHLSSVCVSAAAATAARTWRTPSRRSTRAASRTARCATSLRFVKILQQGHAGCTQGQRHQDCAQHACVVACLQISVKEAIPESQIPPGG